MNDNLHLIKRYINEHTLEDKYYIFQKHLQNAQTNNSKTPMMDALTLTYHHPMLVFLAAANILTENQFDDFITEYKKSDIISPQWKMTEQAHEIIWQN